MAYNDDVEKSCGSECECQNEEWCKINDDMPKPGEFIKRYLNGSFNIDWQEIFEDEELVDKFYDNTMQLVAILCHHSSIVGEKNVIDWVGRLCLAQNHLMNLGTIKERKNELMELAKKLDTIFKEIVSSFPIKQLEIETKNFTNLIDMSEENIKSQDDDYIQKFLPSFTENSPYLSITLSVMGAAGLFGELDDDFDDLMDDDLFELDDMKKTGSKKQKTY